MIKDGCADRLKQKCTRMHRLPTWIGSNPQCNPSPINIDRILKWLLVLELYMFSSWQSTSPAARPSTRWSEMLGRCAWACEHSCAKVREALARTLVFFFFISFICVYLRVFCIRFAYDLPQVESDWTPWVPFQRARAAASFNVADEVTQLSLAERQGFGSKSGWAGDFAARLLGGILPSFIRFS